MKLGVTIKVEYLPRMWKYEMHTKILVEMPRGNETVKRPGH
jgi:hypothetical protein